LRRISGAVISTIHAFGQRLISQNALDLGIAPDFSVLEDDEAERILKEVMAGELRKTLSSGTPEEREPLEELCLGRKPGKLVADTGEFLRRCESRGLEISVIAPEALVPPPPPRGFGRGWRTNSPPSPRMPPPGTWPPRPGCCSPNSGAAGGRKG